jgi:peptidyl-prolyl cis-trans isomerase D
MFESIRKHQRVLQFLLLLLIFPAFAFFGVSGYDQFLSDDDNVAKVDGARITRQDFDQAMRRQLDQMRQVLGDQIDAKLLDTPAARREVLDGLVLERVVQREAANRNLGVSDAKLRASILEIPGLKKPDGSFDMERYQSLLRAQGLNEAVFESQLRRDQTLRLLPEAAAQSALLPAAVATRLLMLQEEVREVRELRLKPAEQLAAIKPTDEQLRKFYDENGRAFETRESAKVEYLVLSADELARGIALGEDDLRGYYTQNAARFTTPEQRRASHILVKLEAGASAADRDKATARARALLTQARGGADFAALAKAQSQDPGSASQGGDLGFFPREAMIKPFADAAFGMKVGEISDLVETEFGLHIIRLTGIQPAAAQSFEAARPAIEAEVRRQQAGRRYAEAAEAFTNLVYEQSDSLKPAADRFKLEIRTADAVERNPAPGAPKSPLNHPKLLTALFSEDSVAKKRNTEAVETGGNTLVSARILEHRPAQRKPFEAVRAEVLARFTEQEARRLTREAGESRLKSLQADPSAAQAGLTAARAVSRQGGAETPSEAVEALFRAPSGKLPVWVGVSLADGSYGLYQITRVIPPSAEQVAARRADFQAQLTQLFGQQDTTSYLEALKARAKVVRHENRLIDKADAGR